MTTITDEDRDKIRATLDTLTLVHGVGDKAKHEACTIAAVNLALTGTLTDDDPAECICPVIRRWVISVQDAMPTAQINAPEWRALIPAIAGTRSTPEVEQQRDDLILDWMWGSLAAIRDVVPESTREAWDRMLDERTYAASAAASAAARAADAAAAASAAAAAAAYAAAASTAATAAHAEASDWWRDANPAGLLAALIEHGDNRG
jgi:hypothetical protein